MALSVEQKAALRQLRSRWPDRRILIVGAAALEEQMEVFWRRTEDLDLAIAIELDELHLLDDLPGWQPAKRREHRWEVGQLLVDVIPVGDDLLKKGRITWPESGSVMNLSGFDLALREGEPLDVGAGLEVTIAPVAVVVLLKMVAFLDRPQRRERDLEDIAHCLRYYLEPYDKRLFEDTVLDSGLDAESAVAFVLGRELGKMLDHKDGQLVRQFLDDIARDSTYRQMARVGPADFRDDPSLLRTALRALRLGIDSAMTV